jgi:hypothetical protein
MEFDAGATVIGGAWRAGVRGDGGTAGCATALAAVNSRQAKAASVRMSKPFEAEKG